ncbi:MAG: restriction endonuclease subunit S, partial [Oscillospiraceae bacterium]|nr:restriction endonuclease subunit S [Oscillospiraceae bacterium]
YFITLQLQREIQRIRAMSQGTSIKGVASKEIKAMIIKVPKKDEQNAIAEVLECSDREIALCEGEIEVWQQKKKALMQLLLTGLVRVNA